METSISVNVRRAHANFANSRLSPIRKDLYS